MSSNAEYKAHVRNAIKKITGSYNEDLEQEVYLKAWENRSNYKEEGKLSAWLVTIAKNICKDYFKRAATKISQNFSALESEFITDETQKQQDEIIQSNERQKIILKAVDELPYKMKEVVVLYEFEELSYDEIATKLNISTGTVKSRLFNAREILSQKLKHLKGE